MLPHKRMHSVPYLCSQLTLHASPPQHQLQTSWTSEHHCNTMTITHASITTLQQHQTEGVLGQARVQPPLLRLPPTHPARVSTRPHVLGRYLPPPHFQFPTVSTISHAPALAVLARPQTRYTWCIFTSTVRHLTHKRIPLWA